MVLEGKLWKEGRFWLIEVLALDLLTQGRSKKEAFAMLADAAEALIHKRGFHLKIESCDDSIFLVESNDKTALMALLLKRQRAKYHLTIAQMAKRLHAKSQNTYAQYEHGKSQPSFSKVQEFLSAMNSNTVMAFTVFEQTTVRENERLVVTAKVCATVATMSTRWRQSLQAPEGSFRRE